MLSWCGRVSLATFSSWLLAFSVLLSMVALSSLGARLPEIPFHEAPAAPTAPKPASSMSRVGKLPERLGHAYIALSLRASAASAAAADTNADITTRFVSFAHIRLSAEQGLTTVLARCLVLSFLCILLKDSGPLTFHLLGRKGNVKNVITLAVLLIALDSSAKLEFLRPEVDRTVTSLLVVNTRTVCVYVSFVVRWLTCDMVAVFEDERFKNAPGKLLNKRVAQADRLLGNCATARRFLRPIPEPDLPVRAHA